jgi:flagellar hook protein FlgE
MISSLQNGITALKSFTEGLQVISNNIANVNSLGYKSTRANYTDTFYRHKNDPSFVIAGGADNSTQDFGGGVKVGSLSSNFNQGVVENTGLDLDLAIEGEALPNAGGFFEVADPITGDTFFTRTGAFEAKSDGLIVTRDEFSYQLLDVDGNPISMALEEGEDLLARRIEEDGTLSVIVSKDNEDSVRTMGQLKLSNFHAPQYLRRVGNGYFSNGGANENFADLIDNPVPASGTNGKIKQFALELSNVDLTNEFAMMISHQRSFQAGSRVVTTSDAILNEAVNLKR